MPAEREFVTKEDLKELRKDLKVFKDEIIHQFHIISEDTRSQIKQVAEGVINVNEKLERYHHETKAEIEDKFGIFKLAIGDTNKRLDKMNHELRHEIQESRQEILAAVKFSYAELDRRLTAGC